MTVKLSMLLSDWLIWGLFVGLVLMFWRLKHLPHLAEAGRSILHRKMGMVSLVILLFYTGIGLLDSLHLEITDKQSVRFESILDVLVSPLGKQTEQSYSAPFACHLYSRTSLILSDGREIQGYPRLAFGGQHLVDPKDRAADISLRSAKAFVLSLISFLLFCFLFIKLLAKRQQIPFRSYLIRIIKGQTWIAWREALLTLAFLWFCLCFALELSTHYHLFGTDKVGNDVFFESIKSIRTALLIGTLTTLFTLPFALFLGVIAGYYRGLADDLIQYLYITLSSIPGVLLISAAVLVLQVYMDNHPSLFPTLAQRADARLLALCVILGITSWTSLCRLVRAETLKLSELEFVLAATALGVRGKKILTRHIIPNVMHIVLITLVLDFSNLVLAEAVLSYVGVGVDPITLSFGNMINSSRLELAREPIVWWPLMAALIFMFFLVLAANLFADVVRDAFDPRLHTIEEE